LCTRYFEYSNDGAEISKLEVSIFQIIVIVARNSEIGVEQVGAFTRSLEMVGCERSYHILFFVSKRWVLRWGAGFQFGLEFVVLAPRICDVISWRLRGDRSCLGGYG
jgi:hypothetical protein